MTKTTCQLAVDVNFDKMRFPLMGFHKVDGVRGVHVTGGLTGRSMDPFKNSAVVAMFADPVYAGFDGEMTIDGRLTGQDLCSLTTGLMNRAKVKKGEEGLPCSVLWNLFDYLAPDIVGLCYFERYQALATYLQSNVCDNVNLLPFTWIYNIEQAEAWIEKCLAEGYEGAIFRDPQAMHKSGRATEKLNDFWRFKPVSDKDAIVLSVYEAEENQNEATTNSMGRTERSSHQENKVGKSIAGGFIATDVATGKEVRIPCGCMKHSERLAVWQGQAAYIGRAFKYTSLDTGLKDQPRQARWTCWRAKEDMS